MPHKVLDVGNCAPDHAAIKRMLASQFGAEVDQADALSDTLAALRDGSYDLVLVNRKLDCDYSDGVEVLKAIKADPDLRETPVMLVTNHDEHQQAAISLGGVYGFGKLALDAPATHARLKPFLAS